MIYLSVVAYTFTGMHLGRTPLFFFALLIYQVTRSLGTGLFENIGDFVKQSVLVGRVRDQAKVKLVDVQEVFAVNTGPFQARLTVESKFGILSKRSKSLPSVFKEGLRTVYHRGSHLEATNELLAP